MIGRELARRSQDPSAPQGPRAPRPRPVDRHPRHRGRDGASGFPGSQRPATFGGSCGGRASHRIRGGCLMLRRLVWGLTALDRRARASGSRVVSRRRRRRRRRSMSLGSGGRSTPDGAGPTRSPTRSSGKRRAAGEAARGVTGSTRATAEARSRRSSRCRPSTACPTRRSRRPEIRRAPWARPTTSPRSTSGWPSTTERAWSSTRRGSWRTSTRALPGGSRVVRSQGGLRPLPAALRPHVPLRDGDPVVHLGRRDPRGVRRTPPTIGACSTCRAIRSATTGSSSPTTRWSGSRRTGSR